MKFNKELAQDSQKADSAYYQCEFCGGTIVDADKADMLAAGEWRADKTGSRKKIGFHLNAIYSPWVTFRDVVAEFLKSKKTPETLMNFINSWLAEPFEQVSSSADAQRVLECQGRYTRGVVPDESRMMTGGVDKQRNCYYYTVRAWGENRRSWNVDHGQVATEAELVEVFDRPYLDEKGGIHYVDFVLIDSGDDTDVVYDFCYLHQGLFAPLKGSSTRIHSRYRLSKIEKVDSRAKGIQLILCDGSYYKDLIFRRINPRIMPDGREAQRDWLVYDGCDEEYARQIVAEHKVVERIAGRDAYVWRPKASGIDNHYLDCEVYAACAADMMGAFDLLVDENEMESSFVPPPPAQPAAQQQEEDENGWLDGGDWL